MSDPLDSLRRQAKTLQKQYESGSPGAISRVNQVGPRDGVLKRADFLHVIARENSFVSWPAMKEAVATLGMDRAAKLQRLKIALMHGQVQRIAALMAETPDLADGHFGLQCALLLDDAVAAALADDPGLAVRQAGPRRPMLHLAFSKAIHIWPARKDAMLRIAQLLVDHGADVNDTYPYPQDGAPMSALYGALGEAGNMVLAAWLLEQGANPNDGESLYHATELGHSRGVALLLRHGADPKGTNALLRAMDHHDAEMVELLLNAGADPHESGRILHHAALRQVPDAICAMLLRAGADVTQAFDQASPYAFARVMGHASLAAMIAERTTVAPLTEAEQMLADAAVGQVAPGTYLDEAQLPAPFAHIIREILHIPGKLDHVKALVALGLFYDKPDNQGLTPVQIAGWEGLPEVMGYFLSLRPDLSHVNGYGGTLLSTIVHGSENNPATDRRDHVACLRLALEQGVALPRRLLEFVGNPEVYAFLTAWADRHPGQVVDA